VKVVLDTNVLVSSFFGGKPQQVIALWARGAVTLCLSPAIAEEYIAVVRRLGLDGRPELEDLLGLFRQGHCTSFASVVPDLHVVTADPDDDKFIACAVALQADVIISGDHHLLDMGSYIDIQILTPAEFLLKYG